MLLSRMATFGLVLLAMTAACSRDNSSKAFDIEEKLDHFEAMAVTGKINGESVTLTKLSLVVNDDCWLPHQGTSLFGEFVGDFSRATYKMNGYFGPTHTFNGQSDRSDYPITLTPEDGDSFDYDESVTLIQNRAGIETSTDLSGPYPTMLGIRVLLDNNEDVKVISEEKTVTNEEKGYYFSERKYGGFSLAFFLQSFGADSVSGAQQSFSVGGRVTPDEVIVKSNLYERCRHEIGVLR